MSRRWSLRSLTAALLPGALASRYEEALAAHLRNQHLPYPDVPGPSSQLHVPLRLRRKAADASDEALDEAKTMDVWDALLCSRRLAVLGEPGAGKTALLKHAALTLVEHELPPGYVRRLTFLHHGKASERLLPIYADLAGTGVDAGDLPSLLARAADRCGFSDGAEFFAGLLRESACLLLLDGFDALGVPQKQRLAELLAAYPQVQIVSVARAPGLQVAFPDWTHFEILPFTPADVDSYVSLRLGDSSPERSALLQAFERDPGLRSMSDNPLLLSVLAWAAVQEQREPLPLPPLYERCVKALWQATVRMQHSPVVVEIDSDAVSKALQAVALDFYDRNQARFDQAQLSEGCEAALRTLGQNEMVSWLTSRMLNSGLVRQEVEERYAFLRCAVQEYLAARELVARRGLSEVLEAHVGDARWHEVIVLGTALRGEADEPVRKILCSGLPKKEAILLASRCGAEGVVSPQSKDTLCNELSQISRAEGSRHSCEASIRLAALAGQRVERYLSDALKEGPDDQRVWAALVLGRMAETDWAVVALLGALDGRNPGKVRKQAAWALGRMGSQRAVRPLCDALKDEDPEVARAAALALAAVGEPALLSLTSALGSDLHPVHRLAVLGLGAMGGQVLAPLLQIVRDQTESDRVVRGAVEALGLLGDEHAIPQLILVLRSQSDLLLESAAAALAAIGGAAVQPLVDALPAETAQLELREAIVRALIDIGEPSIEPLIQSLSSPSTAVRAASEEALTGIGRLAVDALTAALRTAQWSLRRRIAQVLANIGDERLVAPLLEALDDPDPGVRAKAAQILGEIGQETALEALVETTRRDSDEFVRRAAARALAGLRCDRAIAPLVDTLDDPLVRSVAVPALSDMGGPAVEPLIALLNQTEDAEVRGACLQVLEAVGARAGSDDRGMAAVASVYAQLVGQMPELATMLSLLEDVRWWQPADELRRAFFCVQTLVETQSLSELEECRDALAWVSDCHMSSRPALKHVLLGLSRVSQDVGLYFQATDRSGQRDAMLGAIDALAEIQGTIETQLLPFEAGPFLDVVHVWRALTEVAIRKLRGRAELEIQALRDDLPLDSTSLSAMVVFRLTNVGDSAARNLSATLKHSSDDGFAVIGEPNKRLYPLGTGKQRDAEFWIKPHGGTESGYVLEVSYDDDGGTGHFQRTSGRLRFCVVEDEYRPIPPSPYVMGPPVKTAEMFYGRRDVLDWVATNISGAHQENILVLHGERRMGKTSILYQLLNHPPTPRHICVFFSLELDIPESLVALLLGMARAICDRLVEEGLDVVPPVEEDFVGSPRHSFVQFLAGVAPLLRNRRLLIMVDEFDKLIHKVDSKALDEDVYAFVRGLWQHTEKVAFIITGAYKVREMLRDNQSILFHVAKPYRISYLGGSEAQALIVRPVSDFLTYDDLVVDKIIRVTACHPYFIQYICDSLVKLAQRAQRNWLFLPDIDVVLQEVVQDNAGVLQNAVYAPLGRPERMVLAALANVTDDRTIFVPWEVLADVLSDHALSVPKKRLLLALRSLCERDLVSEKRIGRSLQYGFKMDLIRLWLRQNDVLLRLTQEERP